MTSHDLMNINREAYKYTRSVAPRIKGVTLAQLVKASVGQADVQRFEPHLGHKWLSCGVFLVVSPGTLGSLWHKP